MDITLLSEKTLRIKGKTASIIINPSKSTPKTEAEGILTLVNNPDFSDGKFEGSRITIKGQGEYEVAGIKVSATRVGPKLVAGIEVDGVRVLVGDGPSVEKIHEKIEGANIAVISADEEFNYSNLSTIEPKVLIVYGEKKLDVAKSLGKSDLQAVSKFSTTADKLPEEMQFIVLG